MTTPYFGADAQALQDNDPELAGILGRELDRQNTTLQFIASENFTSPAVMAAMGSVGTNKYSEGYPGKRYYGGNQIIDEAEELAKARACALFGAEHANVQPHAGAIANMAAFQALLQPGDRVMGLRLDHGGHLTHGSPVNFSGKLYDFVPYQLHPETEMLDYEGIAELARETRPKMILCGYTAYPRTIDFEYFRQVADEVGALLMADIAHIAGLVAGGAHPSPVPYADVVTFTNHKTLRGPRGATILCKAEHAPAIDKAVFPGLQGGPLMHTIAAKAVSFAEASTPAFKQYAADIVTNAQVLCDALAEQGLRIISGGTDNHLMLVDLRPFGVTGAVAQDALDAAGITLNKNTIPDDPESPFVTSGLRLGTASVTTAGMGPDEMRTAAVLIGRVLRDVDNPDTISAVRDEVEGLCERFVPYPPPRG
jgi:glycine hydroxymethyltransferase